MKSACFVSFAMILTPVVILAQPKDLSRLTGPYLGQKPPDKVAMFFADGIIANAQHGFHTNIVFTPHGDEAYWTVFDENGGNHRIVESRMTGGHWANPRPASFSILGLGDDAPFVSPDGRRLFFLSKRPIAKDARPGKENIWYVEKERDSWSEPRPLPLVINSMEGIHWQISVDGQGNLYFSACRDLRAPAREGDIYCSRCLDGRYAEPERIGNSVNGRGYNCCPYIFPDGRTLLFAREEYDTHKFQIWMTCKKDDDAWTEARELSGYLGDQEQNCPICAADGRVLFFLRYVNSFPQPFWIDAGFIDGLRPKR